MEVSPRRQRAGPNGKYRLTKSFVTHSNEGDELKFLGLLIMKARSEKRSYQILSIAAALILCAANQALPQQGALNGEWHSFGGDPGNTKYTPLDHINRDNFQDLEVAFRWESNSTKVTKENSRIRAGAFKAIPLMGDGLLYVNTAIGQVFAIDLSKGDHAWMQPHGDGPKNHPALIDLNLPLLGGSDSGGPLVTKTLLFVAGGRRDLERGQASISVYDKATGEYLGAIPLPIRPNGNPISYMYQGKQYIAVSGGGGGVKPELMVLSLP